MYEFYKIYSVEGRITGYEISNLTANSSLESVSYLNIYFLK